MDGPILLAVALQNWDRYSGHALAARDVAASLARGSGQALQVLSVYDYDFGPTGNLTADLLARHQDGIRQSTDDLIRRRMEDFITPLKEDSIEVQTHLRVGNPREVIVQTALSLMVDLLVIGSHSKRGIVDVALGGTARQVSRHAPCPVVMVSPKS